MKKNDCASDSKFLNDIQACIFFNSFFQNLFHLNIHFSFFRSSASCVIGKLPIDAHAVLLCRFWTNKNGRKSWHWIWYKLWLGLRFRRHYFFLQWNGYLNGEFSSMFACALSNNIVNWPTKFLSTKWNRQLFKKTSDAFYLLFFVCFWFANLTRRECFPYL